MNRVPERRMVEHPDPEKVAYRYFRWNGFLGDPLPTWPRKSGYEAP